MTLDNIVETTCTKLSIVPSNQVTNHHLNTGHLNVEYSDDPIIQVSSILIPAKYLYETNSGRAKLCLILFVMTLRGGVVEVSGWTDNV